MAQERQNNSGDNFRLTHDELTAPRLYRREWLQSLIGFQLEGLEHGVVPQRPHIGSQFYSLYLRWDKIVYKTFLKTSEGNKKRVQARSLRPGREKHTHPTTGSSGTLSLRVKKS